MTSNYIDGLISNLLFVLEQRCQIPPYKGILGGGRPSAVRANSAARRVVGRGRGTRVRIQMAGRGQRETNWPGACATGRNLITGSPTARLRPAPARFFGLLIAVVVIVAARPARKPLAARLTALCDAHYVRLAQCDIVSVWPSLSLEWPLFEACCCCCRCWRCRSSA